MNPNDDKYTVIFLPESLNQLERFGTLEDLDPALSKVIADLEKNPYLFKSSPQYPNWIVVITRPHYNKRARKHIPSLRLYAAIIEEKKQVKIVDVSINMDDPNIRM